MNLLRAIWTLNRRAKEQSGARQEALYELKLYSIKALYDRGWPDAVNIHTINGTDFYHFQFNNYSFHLPKQQWDKTIGSEINDIDGTKVIDDFSNNQFNREKATDVFPALCTIFNELDLSPNQYYNGTEVPWPDIPGDRVDGRQAITVDDFQS